MYAKIFIEGNIDDLYTLSLLFPEGGYPDLYVVTNLKGRKEGILDRVIDADNNKTYITGPGCELLNNKNFSNDTRIIADKLVLPMNCYGILADSEFKPVKAALVNFRSIETGSDIFPKSSQIYKPPKRLITANRHPNLASMRNKRVEIFASDNFVARAVSVAGSCPNWSDYYRLIENIASDCGTTLDKLDKTGLASREALNGFKSAANNRIDGRHGDAKRSTIINQSDLMDLREARQFVRCIVSKWVDRRCGDGSVMPTDRVNGDALRFGLDN
ncbi:hypothetical protein [Zymomonas mobilis]|uniref:hypothetical protein n=1 Tax=Zymomonas mobilis TaxID=542 RepID=UPI0039E935AC